MNRKSKLLHMLAASSMAALFVSGCKPSQASDYLKRGDWDDNVKSNLNAFIERNKNSSNYVVFDFDNTASIFDVEEQSIIYQLKHMAFNMTPLEMPRVLSTDLDVQKVVSSATYGEWIDDISASYGRLYNNPKYGPFTYAGLSEAKMSEIQKENDWINFAAKLRELYNIVNKCESSDIAYPWVTYLFFGMSKEEIYEVGKASHTYYKSVKSVKETMVSPNMGIGSVSTSFTNGISVSENIVELMKALSENGIDVWICSASNIDLIKAAVDVFGLHEYVTGVLGMSNKYLNGKMINEYDDEARGYLTKANGDWEADSYAFGVKTQGKEKVTAINNALCPRYQSGPIAGFMDSTGDFNFCTEYESLQLVTCFNRASGSLSDGAALIAAIAMHQQDELKWDLFDAIESKDTLYLLQGRNENDMRGFRKSNKTIRLGETEERLFKSDENYALLNYFADNDKTIKEYIDYFAIKTEADEMGNPLGLGFGFLESYDGYHSK